MEEFIKMGKYEFDSEEQAEEKIAKFEGSNHLFARLGAVTAGKFNVDVLWVSDEPLEDHPTGWKSKSVDPEGEGVHRFAGLSYQDFKF